ncbi:MAG: hypothetical protein ABJD68_17775 [Nakamurella sp.]
MVSVATVVPDGCDGLESGVLDGDEVGGETRFSDVGKDGDDAMSVGPDEGTPETASPAVVEQPTRISAAAISISGLFTLPLSLADR